MNNQALTQLELACFHLQDPESLPISTAALWLSGKVSRDRVGDWLEERIGSLSRFRSRVQLQIGGGARWREVPNFSLSDRLRETTASAEQFWDLLSDLHSRPLSLDEPLWSLSLVQLEERSVLLFRIHHAIADGRALISLLTSEPSAEKSSVRASTAGHRSLRLLLRGLWSSLKLLLLSQDPPNRLKGRIGAGKRVAVSGPLPLVDLKRVAHSHRVTVNDLIIALLARTLDRYLDRPEKDLRVVIPVASKSARAEPLSNDFGLVFLPLPLNAQDRVRQLQEAKKRMDDLKESGQAWVISQIFKIPGRLPAFWDQWFTNFVANKATTMMTNLRGPTERVRIAGVPLDEVAFWASTVGRLGSGFSIMSYAGELRIGVTTDSRLEPRPEDIVELFERCWEEWLS